jgi:hypothetical protein
MTPKKEKFKPKWIMPKWMKKYRELIGDTGGNDIEELMNDHHTTVDINAPRALICVAVYDQVGLLTRLYNRGMLK